MVFRGKNTKVVKKNKKQRRITVYKTGMQLTEASKKRSILWWEHWQVGKISWWAGASFSPKCPQWKGLCWEGWTHPCPSGNRRPGEGRKAPSSARLVTAEVWTWWGLCLRWELCRRGGLWVGSRKLKAESDLESGRVLVVVHGKGIQPGTMRLRFDLWPCSVG